MTIPLAKRLKHRIRIEHSVQGKDRSGGKTTSWEPFSTVWADPGASTGGRVKQTEKGGDESIPALPVRIRYLAGVNDRMRVVFRDEVYRIEHVDNERQANRTMLLTCKAIPTGAR
ncbi:SPP1 family predicted phage head-tail adaptor [Pseudoduganella lurida]|uniref:SPP1 family predicted phage head-tail adaptor n=1 Tax=Pseudoduganella lurida TaxID=1036180 RepID=A0A562R8G4_9BURK|nr:phage head closure protein [Pseudoduganella lurida]TWI65173.1 SPP1 family predicted phage head-tail adaptor [Pseudoduganella lurida]